MIVYLYNSIRFAEALRKCLALLGIELRIVSIDQNLNNIVHVYYTAESADLVIADAVINGKPHGVHIIKELKANTLLILHGVDVRQKYAQADNILFLPEDMPWLLARICALCENKGKTAYSSDYSLLLNDYPALRELEKHG